VIHRIPFVILVVLFGAFAHADQCRDSVVLLGNESASGSKRESVPRVVLLNEMASLYSEVLQDATLMPVFRIRLQEIASIEERSPEALHREIEVLAFSRGLKNELRKDREEKVRAEQLRLYSGLEPYLSRLSAEHREIIEREWIHRGLVYPISTGEVEFRFLGRHPFLVGDEDTSGRTAGRVKETSFGPEDSFAIGQVPVTQFMYFLAALGEEGVDPTPSHFKKGEGVFALRLGDNHFFMNPNHPVENVSSAEADAHARRVSIITGLQYELPSELQWEFANRAGSAWKYHFGDDEAQLPRHGWFKLNSSEQSHAVGQLLPNAFRLYDTHGNVWEWTSTVRSHDRIFRGGGWGVGAQSVRSAVRGFFAPQGRYNDLGFRLVRQGPGSARPAHTFHLGELEPE
jgi:hypothetical protein